MTIIDGLTQAHVKRYLLEALEKEIIRARRLMHGKSSSIYHDGKTIYRGLPSPFQAIRYHSLLIERESLPACLEVSAETEAGEIMGVRHRALAIEGVQFHPESIMTQGGKILLKNFLEMEEDGHAEKIHR
jgi:anthranilate synthase/aminodeoxychorismate synthase-like glutamine amidotransferase